MEIEYTKNSFEIDLANESDIPQITKLVNLAYQELADMGLNYTGTYQDDEMTRERISKGKCFLLKKSDKIIGTILFFEDNYATRKKTAYVGQFGILPEYKKKGLGTQLMNYCEELAFQQGYEGIQLDTATTARHLVRWYLNRGYKIVDELQWEGKTYRSYIFEKLFMSH